VNRFRGFSSSYEFRGFPIDTIYFIRVKREAEQSCHDTAIIDGLDIKSSSDNRLWRRAYETTWRFSEIVQIEHFSGKRLDVMNMPTTRLFVCRMLGGWL
jgi:hypothetical protein